MASFEAVNYSLRPSKSIQRQLVFEAVRGLQPHLDLEHLVYVGFGSIWFTDFVLAHRTVGINDMISIEGDPIGFARARFNAPYKTIRVIEGLSSAVLPTLYEDATLSKRPWMIWLDYDYAFDESVKDDVRSVVENVPQNSIFLITFNGQEARYLKPTDRLQRIRDIYGDVVPDSLASEDCRKDALQGTLADLSLAYMKSVAASAGRPGGFLNAFRIVYRDASPMITVGGLLPAKAATLAAKSQVEGSGWTCRPSRPIIAPQLTLREAAVLQSQLPCDPPLDREAVRSLGFDLEERQIDAFGAYYRQYPAFAQIVT